ncbi:MAG: hypothetical protein EON61_06085 [Alphaproteobacteria bacterium]|nr:MAG: hypothetical protein EON61_06085 [Alphaproteobacteria bacterium]
MVELFFICVVAWFVLRALFGGKGADPTPSGQPSPTPNGSPSGSQGAQRNKAASASPDTYRPKRSTAKPRIPFDQVVRPGTSTSGPVNLDGLLDAFTGAPLDRALGLFQCTKCSVFYHRASVDVLRAENSSKCVACGTASLASVGTGAEQARGRNHTPDVITLADYRGHFGKVVTFEGRVNRVEVSKRGQDYAVMFESASWTKGFKLVFFRGAISASGGGPYIKSLASKTVRVRGLLINHPIFGPEIVITEKSMILEVTR